MIFALSWKNIWRSKRRSFVVIGAIVLGVWSLIFMIAFYNSFGEAFIHNSVYYDYSHLQVHNEKFVLEPEIKNYISDDEPLIQYLNNNDSVEAYSSRIRVNGMMNSPKTNTGIQIYGIDTDQESKTTQLDKQLVQGEYFSNISRNPVLISVKQAEKLKVKVRSKIVLTFQDVDNNLTAASFRVAGIFDSKSARINEGVVYVKKSDIAPLIRVNKPHEIAVLLNDREEIPALKKKLEAQTPDLVRAYKEIAPEFNLMEESSNMTKMILTIIMMLALLFGIINTMLMAVLERTREIGMLRSIGMPRRKVFAMIVSETTLLGIISGPIGLLLGYITISWLSNTGMDLSNYADALRDFGYDTIFYPKLRISTYPFLMLVVILTALIGAIYPALKAIHLNPLEAIRKL